MEEMIMTYAELRQRVLAKLAPEAEASDQERALYGIAHIAVSGDAEGATLDQFISEGDWTLVEHAMVALETQFADEIAELRRLLAADTRPSADQAAALWRDFISELRP
jgi:hypothetical protein